MLKISSILSALTITIKLCVSPDYTRRHKEISPKGRSINENEISAKSGKKKKKKSVLYLFTCKAVSSFNSYGTHYSYPAASGWEK